MSKEMLQPAARAAHSGGNARYSSVMQIYIYMGIIASKNPLPDLYKLGTSCLDELSAGFKHMTQSITCPLLR